MKELDPRRIKVVERIIQVEIRMKELDTERIKVDEGRKKNKDELYDSK